MCEAEGSIAGVEKVRIRRPLAATSLELPVHDFRFGVESSFDGRVRGYIHTDLQNGNGYRKIDPTGYSVSGEERILVDLQINRVAARDELRFVWLRHTCPCARHTRIGLMGKDHGQIMERLIV